MKKVWLVASLIAMVSTAHAETVNLTFCKTEGQIIEYTEALVKKKTPWRQAFADMNKSGEVCKTGIFSFEAVSKKDAFVHDNIQFIVVTVNVLAAHMQVGDMMAMVLPITDIGYAMQYVKVTGTDI